MRAVGLGWGAHADRLMINKINMKRDIINSPQFMKFSWCHVSVLINEAAHKVNPSHEFFFARTFSM
jgi:hypothetical protein